MRHIFQHVKFVLHIWPIPWVRAEQQQCHAKESLGYLTTKQEDNESVFTIYGMNQPGIKAMTSQSQGRNATIWLLNKYVFWLHHANGIVVDDMEYNILLLPYTVYVCLLKSVKYWDFPIGPEEIILIFMQYILNGKCKSKMCCLGYGWSSTLLMTCLRLS